MDVYGWAIPPRADVFPHLRGEITGFGQQHRRLEQFQEHYVCDDDAFVGKGRLYDLTIFGIVKFFQLAMDNNPNIIDSLFTLATCVQTSQRPAPLSARTALPTCTAGLAEVQGARLRPASQARDQGAERKTGGPRGRARLRHEVRVPHCASARRG